MKTTSKEKAYNKITNKYDDVLTGRKWWSRIYMNCLWKVDDNAIAHEVAAMIPDDFRGKILDIPVGTAVFTAEKYTHMQQAKIVGIDYSQDMLDIAIRRKETLNIKNLRLEQGDVCNLSFADDSFNLVLSMNGFHAFPADKRKAFTETFRVLKPGGVFLGCFYIKGERKIADWFVRNVLNKKGFFTPPHYNKQEAIKLLHSLYNNVEVKNYRSILIFKCIK